MKDEVMQILNPQHGQVGINFKAQNQLLHFEWQFEIFGNKLQKMGIKLLYKSTYFEPE
jgi:hypothetical protein